MALEQGQFVMQYLNTIKETIHLIIFPRINNISLTGGTDCGADT